MGLSSFISDFFKPSKDQVQSIQTLIKSPEVAKELSKINQDLYERNVELAIRNRTLSVLRKMYDIINSSIGVKLTAQKLIDEIVTELKFQIGFIALVSKDKKTLSTLAVSATLPETQAVLDVHGKPFQNFSISLEEKGNFSVDSVLHNRRRLSNILHDILIPVVSPEVSQNIQEKLDLKTSMVYPVLFGGSALGVMMVGMNKHVGELSRAERETLHELVEVVSIAIERAQIFEDLQFANEQLKELDKIKDEFVYMASHELRTPMTAIKNYLWLALNKHKDRLDESLTNDLNRAYISTERLIRLVQDMLTVSRIEGKRLIFDIKPVKVEDVARQIVDELSPIAKEKNLTLIFVPTTESFVVQGDQTRIMEILQNFIGNSLKFTPSGGAITVSIRRNNGMVETSVSDTGVGIPKDDLPRLFQKFGRLGHSYKRFVGETGTGLGLFITKQIVEAHGGKIFVASEVDHGSTFTFALPEYHVGAPNIIDISNQVPPQNNSTQGLTNTS